jgi:hypothetical protein
MLLTGKLGFSSTAEMLLTGKLVSFSSSAERLLTGKLVSFSRNAEKLFICKVVNFFLARFQGLSTTNLNSFYAKTTLDNIDQTE